MKLLYQFTLSREEEVEEVQINKDAEGNEVRITKKVKKLVPKIFGIKKPTRSLRDSAELYYGVKFSEGVKAGLLTNALLNKRFENDNGMLTNKEKERLAELHLELANFKRQFQELTLKKDATEEDKKKLEEVTLEISRRETELQRLEMQHYGVYNNTAESRAAASTVLWWALFLAYKQNDKGEWEEFFGPGDHAARQASYDDLEEEADEFTAKVISRFIQYVSFLYVGKTPTDKDLENIEKEM